MCCYGGRMYFLGRKSSYLKWVYHKLLRINSKNYQNVPTYDSYHILYLHFVLVLRLSMLFSMISICRSLLKYLFHCFSIDFSLVSYHHLEVLLL